MEQLNKKIPLYVPMIYRILNIIIDNIVEENYDIITRSAEKFIPSDLEPLKINYLKPNVKITEYADIEFLSESFIYHLDRNDKKLQATVASTACVGKIEPVPIEEIGKHGDIIPDMIELASESNRELLTKLKKPRKKDGYEDLKIGHSVRPAYGYIDSDEITGKTWVKKTPVYGGREAIEGLRDGKYELILVGTSAALTPRKDGSGLDENYVLFSTSSKGLGASVWGGIGFETKKGTITACARPDSECSRALERFKRFHPIGRLFANRIKIEDDPPKDHTEIIKEHEKWDLISIPTTLGYIIEGWDKVLIADYEGDGTALISKERVKSDPSSVKEFLDLITPKINKNWIGDYIHSVGQNVEFYKKYYDENSRII